MNRRDLMVIEKYHNHEHISPVKAPIYQKWLKLKRAGVLSPEFQDYNEFYDWAWSQGMSTMFSYNILRYTEEPYSPNNTYLVIKKVNIKQ